MGKFSKRVYIGLIAITACVPMAPLAASPNPTVLCNESYKAGYIKKVWLNDPQFVGDNFMGIEVSYPSAPGGPQTRYYTSEGWATIMDAPGKILMQLANSAYVSQSKVFVMVDGGGSNPVDCAVASYKQPWVLRLKGLVLTSKPND